MARTLILGGGFGGLGTADELRKRIPDGHEVVVVDQAAEFAVGAAKTWVMTGEKRASEILHSRDRLAQRGIRFVRSVITKIDPATRSVETEQGRLDGDALVVALGAAVNMAAVPGLAEAAETFYTLEGAIRLQDRLHRFERGRVVLLIPRAPYKCPAGPYEGILMIADHLRKRRPSGKFEFAVYTVEGSPMATGGPEIGERVKAQLAKAGVGFHNLRKTVSVDGAAKTIRFEDGSTEYDLLVAIPPHEAPAVVRSSGLAGPNGWIPADPKTLEVKGHPNVYAIGDVSAVPLPGRFKPDVPLSLPKAGVIAEGQGRTVARVIASKLGHGDPDSFDGKGYCYIETGDLHAMRGDGSFYELPHPSMASTVPDMMQYYEKQAWVDGVVKRLLG